MKITRCLLLFLVLHSPLWSQNSGTQIISDSTASPYATGGLFGSHEIFEICLKGDIRKLFRDRQDDAIYHPIHFSYQQSNGIIISLDIKVKTRGHFRRMRENCNTPPLYLNFDSVQGISKTIFNAQPRLKLVTACIDDKYVLHEYLVYKIYQLITEKSFRARLVKVRYNDIEKGKETDPKFGILLEDQNDMAERNNSRLLKRLNVKPRITDREMFLKMTVFQFLIGNTDWSIQYLHNIKLISGNDSPALIPVPYDFDLTGIVGAPYALPPEQLQLQSVKQRRYRGYCIEDMGEFEPIFDLFNDLKDEIYQIYTDNPLLDEKYIKRTLKYLDAFYIIINDSKAATKAFQYPCNSRADIVIKGLKKRNEKKKPDKKKVN